MKIIRAVGIDLGTTNSAVSAMTPLGNEIALLEDRFKRKTIPSMVGWDPPSESFVTGWEAWNRRTLEPAPIASIKRKMGTQRTVNVGPHSMLPEEVSARILRRLTSEMHGFLERQNQEDDHSYPVTHAVITVPAYFDAQQIEATRRAGELADLEVVSLLQEPTSAAMYHAWKHGIGDGTFLVYDLGGGTFDVSVIRCLMGEYQVLGIDGDNYLGGDDFDRRLAEHIRKKLVEQGYALDLDIARYDDDATRFTLLVRLAQEVKEALSHAEVQYVGRRNIFEDQEGNPVSIEMEISRDEFEELIADLVEQSLQCCERALVKSAEAADITLSEIEHVLLVGGSTRVPMVQREVAARFCGEHSKAEKPLIDEPDTCVALGAAIHAANVAGLTLEDGGDDFNDPSSVTLTSGLSTQSSTGRLVGRLSSPNESLVESVVLIDAVGDIAAIARPEQVDGEEGLLFTIEEIPLEHEGQHAFSLEFCDEDGDAVAAFGVPMMRISREEMLRSTGSALSNPSVLAKDLYMEVVRDGKAARQILLRSGTSLPAEEKFRFYTADRSGAVILRVYQNRFPIRTIHLGVTEGTDVGTPIDFNLSVDEAMTMVASGELQGQTFWAQIEPPPERELKEWEQIEDLLDRVEVINRELWGYEARYFKERSDPLVAGIRETVRTDPDKLQVLVARLEEVVEEYHERDTALTPGWGRYEAVLNGIKRVVFRGDGNLNLGLKLEEWRQRLEQLEAEANEAFNQHDQVRWSKVFGQVQAIWESLAQDEYRFTRNDPEKFAQQIELAVRIKLEDVELQLGEFNYSSNPETKQLQEERVNELQQELRSKVASPLRQIDIERMGPGPARQELEKLRESLEYFERQIEKLPTIGLVRN